MFPDFYLDHLVEQRRVLACSENLLLFPCERL
jgi:hypothetical protein